MKNILKKLSSVKVWALIFCCSLLTYIAISKNGNAKELIDAGVAKLLAYAPLSYFLVNVAEDFVFQNKNMFNKKQNENEEAI